MSSSRVFAAPSNLYNEMAADSLKVKWKEELVSAIKAGSLTEVYLRLENLPGDISELLNDTNKEKTDILKVRTKLEKDSLSISRRFSLPVFVAAIHGQNDIVRALHDNGGDILMVDKKGDSIIHSLIWAAA